MLQLKGHDVKIILSTVSAYVLHVFPHKVNLFASYGVYSNSTGTISSADLELGVLDRFVKRIGVELASKPDRESVVFIVEAATGVVVVRL